MGNQFYMYIYKFLLVENRLQIKQGSTRALRYLVVRGSDSPPDCHSLPLLLQVPASHKKTDPTLVESAFLVRETGLEPVRRIHTPLKRARLPVPPLSRGNEPIILVLVPFVKCFFAFFCKFYKK